MGCKEANRARANEEQFDKRKKDFNGLELARELEQKREKDNELVKVVEKIHNGYKIKYVSKQSL